MRCPCCNSHMFVLERSVQPHSTQTWYQCTICSGQRLLSAHRLRFPGVWGAPLTSRFQFETPSKAETGSDPYLPRYSNPSR